ncbi:hypothetical protein BS50DRAFT_134012 [Corynespora cassiicola Philippines]|uniref:Uncharacterized protein n=1 Tax=Corynespora cassiicola Philippines TaxID=1448308 RepID=A0A2T2N9M5_CORCC|nr:hypothetical protein BS50DRAFT_134012 [Corynespora cassiicola Philippines]
MRWKIIGFHVLSQLASWETKSWRRRPEFSAFVVCCPIRTSGSPTSGPKHPAFDYFSDRISKPNMKWLIPKLSRGNDILPRARIQFLDRGERSH